MRSIPGTMATQHPDNAFAPYWDDLGRPFVSVYQEIAEAVACFKDLGVSEYMWDWEGKHADAAVIDRLFSDYYDYFSKNQLGRDKFLTFRIPNIWEEKGYNLLQAMTVILSSEDFARDLKIQSRPLFEVILPMTERAGQLMHIHTLFEKLAKFKSREFTSDNTDNTKYLELIPLVESVESQLAVADLLTDYTKAHKRHFGHIPTYIRPFLACSDSALSSGLLAGIIGNKVALSRLYEFSGKTGIPVFPIAGCGSLNFRGGLTPATVDRFLSEFPGVRTVTVQSSFRYDHPRAEVKKAIAKLERELPKNKPGQIKANDQEELVKIAKVSAKFYKQTLKGILPHMQPIFAGVPKRRDRRQHIGLLGYGRTFGNQKMPRAITFTAGFYSIGVPPEFIGAGRALKSLNEEQLGLLRTTYPNIAKDFEASSSFLNYENLKKFASGSREWRAVMEDVKAIEEVLDIKLGPNIKDQQKHYELSGRLIRLADNQDPSELIARMAGLRKSLG